MAEAVGVGVLIGVLAWLRVRAMTPPSMTATQATMAKMHTLGVAAHGYIWDQLADDAPLSGDDIAQLLLEASEYGVDETWLVDVWGNRLHIECVRDDDLLEVAVTSAGADL